MVLAKSAVVACAGGVEVSQDDVMEPAGFALEVTHSFNGEFGLAVGIYGNSGIILAQGDVGGRAIDGGGTAEDEFVHAGVLHSAEQIVSGTEIVVVILQGMFDGLAYFYKGGEMHHGVDFVLFEGFDEQVVIGEVTLYKGCVFYCLFVACAEVVKDERLVTLTGEHSGHIAADVTCSSANEYSHTYTLQCNKFSRRKLYLVIARLFTRGQTGKVNQEDYSRSPL